MVNSDTSVEPLFRLGLIFLITVVAIVSGEAHTKNKCLLDHEVVIPRKYVHYNSKTLSITLDVSNRTTHQLSTHIFKIFLEDVVGYDKVEILYNEDNFNVSQVIDRLDDTKTIFPRAMLNLEVWVPPEFDTFQVDLIRECGSVAPPGRFGWFIPRELNFPLHKMTYYTADPGEVHWTFLRDIKIVPEFDLDPETIHLLEQLKETPNATYVPSQCTYTTCAYLLAPHHSATYFVKDHIDDMQLLVKVIWLGNNFNKSLIDNLTKRQKKRDKSLLLLNWSPSEGVLHEKDFISVAFKHCELMNSSERVGCRYEMHRLVKFSWNQVEKIAQPLYDAVRRFRFEQDEYISMLQLYTNSIAVNPDLTMEDLACSWMRNNGNIWVKWKSNTETSIYIGGIFPVSGSSYTGIGIVRGANMAKDAINLNSKILPNYKLTLIITDGQCRADNVMKNFIDFIVEKYYKDLIGVLGPACSDTVEPLAGVARHYKLLTISYSAEGASFSDRQKYPYFFRTIGENQHYKYVYLELFKKFGWNQVAALTEDGQKYTEYISSMQDLLEKNKISFISNKKFPRERETEAMKRYLEDLQNKRARIIIADVVEEVARTVMCEAYRLKMTATDGYVWFLPMWLNATWYNTDYFNKGNNESVNCTTSEMLEAIAGYFAMTHSYFAPDNELMQENITVGEWREKYKNQTNRGALSSNYAGFAYDAVWTYAFALDKLSRTDPEALSDLHSENTTLKLVKLIEATDFKGVSGRIKFRGGPSRFSVIDIMEFYGNKTHKIGEFLPNLTDDKPEVQGGTLKLNESAIKWFTVDGKKPEDGKLPPPVCAVESLANFFNIECNTAMICLNLMVAGLSAFIILGVYLYMKKQYEKKVQKTEELLKSVGWDVLPKDWDKWEIERESVVINRKLGEGAFGTVYGGEANFADKDGWVAVAVKTLKMGSSAEDKLDFLSEAEVMKRFDHKNIVKLLGVCTKSEPVYTIMEFMLYGDLKTFLLARRHLVNTNSDEAEEISSKKLTNMALDIARGLSYLAQLKCVHRDVASRNCLVNAQRVVKLGDFGMTRPTQNDYYRFNRKGMLPVRWMSPESLALGIFTPASDVWSYGVLLYEIITFGSFPFQGKSNAQVLELVKNGHTLDIPKGIKPQLEGLIKSCWEQDGKARPTASAIVEFLANNPRLLSPCLDVPLASVQLDESDQLEMLPKEFRKFSSTSFKGSPTLPNGSSSLSFDVPLHTGPPEGSNNIPLENCCPRAPLLGHAKSSSSLLNFSKYVTIQHNNQDSGCPDDEEDYVNHSPTANGHVVTKV